jgi:hypothetical protein
MRNKLGMKGYGIYWFLIERLADAGGYLPMETIPIYSVQMGVEPYEIEQLINEFDLFQFVEEQYFSERLIRHLKLRNQEKENKSFAGKKSGEARAKKSVQTENEHVFDDCSTDNEQRKEKKRKEKEIKEKINIVETMDFSPFSIGFEKVWSEWKRYKTEQHGFKYKSGLTEKKEFNRLLKLSQNNESYAIELLDLAMSRAWEGFHIPNDKKVKQNEPANRDQARIDYWNHMVDTFGTDEEKATRKIV